MKYFIAIPLLFWVSCLTDIGLYYNKALVKVTNHVSSYYKKDWATTYDIVTSVYNISNAEGVPASIVLAIIEHESNFNPKATNGIAHGLMQITKQSGQLPKNPYDVKENIKAGINVLKIFSKNRDLPTAIQMYNSGYSVKNTKYSRNILKLNEKYKQLLN